MSDILILRFTRGEGPGYLADVLDRHGLPHRLIRIDRGEPLPDSIDDARGLVLMGGPMSVNDDLPWIPPVLALTRAAVGKGTPVLGHCLGGQLMSKALGGGVTRNLVKEFGWLPVEQVEGPATAAWLGDLPVRFEVFHWHGETFSIPPGAERILRSDHCAHQAFAVGNSLALQCHIEMTADMVRDWAEEGAADLTCPAPSIQGAAEMTRDLPARVAALHGVADILYARWLAGLA